MRANFVDTLLARLDGEVAPIWVCVLLRLDAPPSPSALRDGLRALVHESPRLRVGWHGRRSWRPAPRTERDIDAALLIDEAPTSEASAVSRAIAARIDLARDLPLRLELTRMTDPEGGAWLLSIALHHAVGDAKALGHLLERLWLHVGGAPVPPPPPAAPLTDGAIVRAALRRPSTLLRLASPKYKLLAPRGVGLRRSAVAGPPGRPMLASARLDLRGAGPAQASDIFFASVLAVAASHAAREGIVRLRVPVDLRPSLGLGRVLGNGCSAVPVEFARGELLALADDPAALARLARSRLSTLVALGVPITTALECLLASALPRELLRRGAVPGLLAERRTNTLVVTYVGSIDRHFEGAPLAIRSARTHTATWGITGFCLGGRLTFNVACFEGLWAQGELEAFTRDLAAWAAQSFRLPPPELMP